MDIPEVWSKLYEHRKDERSVELPWIWSNLLSPDDRGKKILDVGCCESGVCNALAEFGYDVYGIDIRDCRKIDGYSGKYALLQGDVRKTQFLDGYFDQILAISTVEHIGLSQAYSNTWSQENGDRAAMIEMGRILRRGGNCLVTVPYGCHMNDWWIRYYNHRTLLNLVAWYVTKKIEYYQTFKQPNYGKWEPCTEEKASKCDVELGGKALAIACCQLTKR